MEYSIDMVLVSYNNSNGSVIMLVAVVLKLKDVLTHLFPKHPFPIPWKHKTVRVFSYFQGVEKGWIGNKWVNP